jgi:hypothetical protein
LRRKKIVCKNGCGKIIHNWLLQINGGIKSKETKLSSLLTLVKYYGLFLRKTPTAKKHQRPETPNGSVARPSPSKPPSATALFFFSLWLGCCLLADGVSTIIYAD